MWDINVIGLVASDLGLLLSFLGVLAVILIQDREIRRLQGENLYLRERIERLVAERGEALMGNDREAPDVSEREAPVIQTMPGGNVHIGIWRFVITVSGLSVALLGLCLTFLSQHREILRWQEDSVLLKRQLAYSIEQKDALKQASKHVELLPNVHEWQVRHKEYAVRFWVTDDQDRPIVGCKASVPTTGEQAITYEGGLTGSLWMGLGDKVLIEKDGYKPQEIFLDLEKAKKLVIHAKLRRKDHVNEEVLE